MPKVIVKEFFTHEVVKEVPCDSSSKAEKVEAGLNRNLNQDLYYTTIVD